MGLLTFQGSHVLNKEGPRQLANCSGRRCRQREVQGAVII